VRNIAPIPRPLSDFFPPESGASGDIIKTATVAHQMRMIMEKKESLSREYTPEEIVEETRGVDDTLPEAETTRRRALSSDRGAGGAEHRTGQDEEREEPKLEGLQKLADPPTKSEPYKGA